MSLEITTSMIANAITGLESAVRLEVERIRIDTMLEMSHTAAPGMTRMSICDQNTLLFFLSSSVRWNSL
jgi:hypothetical protein